MRDIFVTEQFLEDLGNLDKSIRERVPKTIRQIEDNPHHPGLETHSYKRISKRKMMRSRVNYNFRLLWEWLDQGSISLWRVGKHEVMDAIDYLPDAEGANRKQIKFGKIAAPLSKTQDQYDKSPENQPFGHFPDNLLRLFGVPDDELEAVKRLSDPEAIWDLPIPENVQCTLYDILLQGEDWTADSFLAPRQLLYRTTADKLEGYCKGKIKRLLLNLNAEQQAYVQINATGPILIKGVAGSGKTTIGLYRAQYLAELMEKQRRLFGEGISILMVTYTRTLAKALKQLYKELYGGLPGTIIISTYDSWMLRQFNRRGIRYNAASYNVRRELMQEALREVAQKNSLQRSSNRWWSPDYLLEEIDTVIRARRLEKLTKYQSIERVGRGIGLDKNRHRPIVWEIYERYQQKLDRRNLFDWKDLPRLVRKYCQPLPQYDVVIIDEAQDLSPSHLNLATKLIPNYTESRSLTLLADPAQSIYYRGIPWKEGGINIRGGRTRILAKNFRNTRQILEASRYILEGCKDLKMSDEYIHPSSAYRAGPMPTLLGYSNEYEAAQFIIQKIIRLCRSGKYRPSDIAILARQQRALKNIEKQLTQASIPCEFFRNDFDLFENQVKLITMHSAKGLEFPAVFMIELDNSIIPRIPASSETKEEDEWQERKLFYVSMTRAAERLYLLYPKHNRCRFLQDLDHTTVVSESAGPHQLPFKRKRKLK